jgi:dTDP-alpha-D-glucose dehydrogenase
MHGTVCVVGLGHVGLPLAVKIAASGRKVIGVDQDENALRSIQDGTPSFYETGLDEMLSQYEVRSNLSVSHDYAEVRNCDVIIVAVGTPVSDIGEPVFSHLDNCTKSLAGFLQKGHLLIYRSTIPPGTLRKRISPELERISGLTAGRDFFLSYCPERLVEGAALRELKEIPHLVGGINDESANLAVNFFSSLGSTCFKVSKPEVAEMAKIMDNVYRDVNIALANEFSLACQNFKVDVLESISAANSSPRTKILIPGCGVGGSCLNKDPYMLLWSLGSNYPFGHVIRSARKINESMPTEFGEVVSNAINDGVDCIVSILGIGFKSGTDDVRGSVTPLIVKFLRSKGYRIKAYDPHVHPSISSKLLGEAMICQSLDEAVKDSSALVICSDHQEFRDLDLRKIRSLTKNDCVIADGRQIVNPNLASEMGFRYVAIGRTG